MCVTDLSRMNFVKLVFCVSIKSIEFECLVESNAIHFWNYFERQYF